MSVSLLKPVDPERLAETASWVKDSLPVARMPRLREMLVSATLDGPDALVADCRLRFSRDDNGRLRLEGEVHAVLPLECQRCLEPAMLPVTGRFSMAIVESEAEADGLPSDLDPLFRERRLVNPVTVAEDELILAMPQVARHAKVSQCGAVGRDERLISDTPEPEPPEQGKQPTQRPFQVLAGLGKDRKRGK